MAASGSHPLARGRQLAVQGLYDPLSRLHLPSRSTLAHNGHQPHNRHSTWTLMLCLGHTGRTITTDP